MKTILNVLLLLAAIAWTYYGNTNKAHAYVPSEYAENTQKLVDSSV